MRETGNPEQLARFTCVAAWRKAFDALLGPAAGSVPIHPDSRQGTVREQMAATAQDASAPLRGPDKKDEDRDEDSKQCYA